MASLFGLVEGVSNEINTPVGASFTVVTKLTATLSDIQASFLKGKVSQTHFSRFLAELDEGLGIIHRGMERTSDLIKNFKQVAVDQTSEEARRFNLLEYVDEIIVSLHPELKRAKHELVVDGDRDAEITSYPGAISQIGTNHLMNSVNHAYEDDEQGRININGQKERQRHTPDLQR